jgi:hypothetical protein
MSGVSITVPIPNDSQKALFIGRDGIFESDYPGGLPPQVIHGDRQYNLMAYGYRVGIYFERMDHCEGGRA